MKLILIYQKTLKNCRISLYFRLQSVIAVLKWQGERNENESLYINNAKLIIEVINKLNLKFLYDPIFHQNDLNSLDKAVNVSSKRLVDVQNIKMDYLHNTEILGEVFKSEFEKIKDKNISSRELIIYPFSSKYLYNNKKNLDENKIEDTKHSASIIYYYNRIWSLFINPAIY